MVIIEKVKRFFLCFLQRKHQLGRHGITEDGDIILFCSRCSKWFIGNVEGNGSYYNVKHLTNNEMEVFTTELSVIESLEE